MFFQNPPRRFFTGFFFASSALPPWGPGRTCVLASGSCEDGGAPQVSVGWLPGTNVRTAPVSCDRDAARVTGGGWLDALAMVDSARAAVGTTKGGR